MKPATVDVATTNDSRTTARDVFGCPQPAPKRRVIFYITVQPVSVLNRVEIQRQWIIGWRGLLAVGAAMLVAGWAGTALLFRQPTLVAEPQLTITGLWAFIFIAIAVIALFAAPRHMSVNPATLMWTGLNIIGLGVTLSAIVGVLPPELTQYAYWHVWVLIAVIGFAATGTLLEREDLNGQVYFTAAGLELSILFIGLGALEVLIPGLYLLLAFVHPVPLVLDSLPNEPSPGRKAAIQLGSYTLGLSVILFL